MPVCKLCKHLKEPDHQCPTVEHMNQLHSMVELAALTEEWCIPIDELEEFANSQRETK